VNMVGTFCAMYVCPLNMPRTEPHLLGLKSAVRYMLLGPSVQIRVGVAEGLGSLLHVVRVVHGG
jgi:hypothetical protein